MTLPPPPGGNPPTPPPGGPFQPPVGGPGPYPGPGPQQPPWPQQSWPAGPPPPQKRGNGWKWALGAVALLAVIGVTAAVTMSVTGDNDGGNGSPTSPPSGNNSGIASANDTGPATIITEDPTCAAWTPINNTLAQIAERTAGTSATLLSLPQNWTPELRAQYDGSRAGVAQCAPTKLCRWLSSRRIGSCANSTSNSSPTPARIAMPFLPTLPSITIWLVLPGQRISAGRAYVLQLHHGSAQARAPLVAGACTTFGDSRRQPIPVILSSS